MNGTATYVLNQESGRLQLENPNDFPTLARAVVPSPGLRAFIDDERRRRDETVKSFVLEVGRLERELEAGKRRLEDARHRLRTAVAVQWDEGVHRFSIHVGYPEDLPFPGSRNQLQSKTLSECRELHCAVRGGIFESTQQDIDRVLALFQQLRGAVDSAEVEVPALERQLQATLSILGQARFRNTEPVRVPSNMVTVPFFQVRPIPASTTRGGVF